MISSTYIAQLAAVLLSLCFVVLIFVAVTHGHFFLMYVLIILLCVNMEIFFIQRNLRTRLRTVRHIDG